MEISRSADKAEAQQRGKTFTGEVWAKPVLTSGDGATINNVLFTPGARTYWHAHERGQFLHVVSGAGLVCADGGSPREIGTGDVVWAPAGELHWHGASPSSFLNHIAVSLGTTSWGDEVSDEQYSQPPL